MMVASLAISTVTSVAGVAGAQQQAKTQANYQAQMGEAARQNAMTQYSQLQRRTTEEQAAANAELENNAIEAAQARSRARVAASAAGVTGLSVDNLLADIYGQEGRRQEAVRTNLSYTEMSLRDSMDGVYAGAQSSVNQARTPVQAPGWATAALKIGADAFNSYNTYFPLPE